MIVLDESIWLVCVEIFVIIRFCNGVSRDTHHLVLRLWYVGDQARELSSSTLICINRQFIVFHSILYAIITIGNFGRQSLLYILPEVMHVLL
jgi:hypothetical protein